MFAYIAEEMQEREVLGPVIIIDHFGGIGAGAEVEEFFELFLNTVLVITQGVFIEKVSFFGFP
jgi:hypothetical protein